jgi:undecaprenyl-diphosphatase
MVASTQLSFLMAPLAQASGSIHLSAVQLLVLALLQGVAELFPISSLGHTVIAPSLLGWHIDQKADSFLPFVVALHLGTATALLVYFRRDWAAILRPLLQSVQRGRLGADPMERLGWLVAAGTVPAGILGALFEKPLKQLFADPQIAAALLIINGFVLLLGERLRAQARVTLVLPGSQPVPGGRARPIRTLNWGTAVAIGAVQALALLPGISRSGAAMVGGLTAGLSHEAAARFAFLLATPLILAAGLLEVPTLFSAAGRPMVGDALVGGILAGLAAYASVRFLMRYFRVGRLDPFAYYCWAAGSLALIILALCG